MLGHEQLLKLMLQASEHPEIDQDVEDSRKALSWACESSNEKVVKMLLDTEADVDARSRNGFGTVLLAVSAEGYEKVVWILLGADADANADAEANANADPQDRSCSTALYEATYRGYEKVVQTLFHAGANVHAHIEDGDETALHGVSKQGYETIVQMLLHAGVDVYARDCSDITTLRCASITGNEKVV
jgi:ankyrin repeat protein